MTAMILLTQSTLFGLHDMIVVNVVDLEAVVPIRRQTWLLLLVSEVRVYTSFGYLWNTLKTKSIGL